MATPEIRNVFSMGGTTLVRYTSDGSKLVVAGSGGVARVYAVGQDEQEPDSIDILEEASDLVISQDGGTFAVCSTTGEVEIYSIKDLEAAGKPLRSPLPLRALAFTHNDTRLCAAGDDDEVQIVDVRDTQHIIKFRAGDQIHDLAYNQRKDYVALSLSSGEIKIYSLSSEEPQIAHSIQDEAGAYIYQDDDPSAEDNIVTARVEWHPDGSQFAVPCANKSIKVFNASQDFEQVFSFIKRHSEPLVDLKWCPTGDYLASVDLSNKLIVWDTITREAVVEETLGAKVLNLSWNQLKNGKFGLAAGSASGNMILFDGIVEEKKETNGNGNTAERSILDDLMAEEDDDEEEEEEGEDGMLLNGDKDSENEDGDADDINLMSDASDDNNDNGEDLRDFVDDDDGLLEEEGYTIPSKKRAAFDEKVHDDSDASRKRPMNVVRENVYTIKPYSPGCTPYISDRRYLTINSIGYVSSVRQDAHYAITVSFFDQSVHREYHFDDLYGYDLASLTSAGLLLGYSGKVKDDARVMFRPHDNVSESWEKIIPTSMKEIISSVSLSDSVILVCTSKGFIRNYSLFGVPSGIQKSSPVIASATNTNYILTVSIANNRQLVYNLQDLDGRFLQRDLTLPLEVTNLDLFRGIFFSTYGDPVVVGNDGIVLVLSRWRSPLQARWVPLLDSDTRIRDMGGKGELTVWPLGLHGDNLNCLVIRGSQYPTYPLQLPTELEVRMPVGGQRGDEENPEEELVRARTMGELLGETLSNEGELFEDDEERLNGYAIQHDRAVLKLIVSSCSEEKVAKAWKLAQDLQQDKALAAASKVAERVGLVALVNRINKLREQRMDQELASQS